MLNQEFIGKIVSISTKLRKLKNQDDEKIVVPFKKIQLVSSAIEDDELAKTFPEIYATITQQQPPMFKSIDFGEQNLGRLKLEIKPLVDEDTLKVQDWSVYNHIEIKGYVVKNDEGIFQHKFNIEFLTGKNDTILDNIIGNACEIKFSELEVE
jgi:hypothetical protein